MNIVWLFSVCVSLMPVTCDLIHGFLMLSSVSLSHQKHCLLSPIRAPSVYGLSFLKIIELVGLFPWNTFIKQGQKWQQMSLICVSVAVFTHAHWGVGHYLLCLLTLLALPNQWDFLGLSKWFSNVGLRLLPLFSLVGAFPFLMWLTLCGSIFSRASPLRPPASSSFLASSVVLPFIRASVWARKLASRIYSRTSHPFRHSAVQSAYVHMVPLRAVTNWLLQYWRLTQLHTTGPQTYTPEHTTALYLVALDEKVFKHRGYLMVQVVSDGMLWLSWDQEVTGHHACSWDTTQLDCISDTWHEANQLALSPATDTTPGRWNFWLKPRSGSLGTLPWWMSW